MAETNTALCLRLKTTSIDLLQQPSSTVANTNLPLTFLVLMDLSQ